MVPTIRKKLPPVESRSQASYLLVNAVAKERPKSPNRNALRPRCLSLAFGGEGLIVDLPFKLSDALLELVDAFLSPSLLSLSRLHSAWRPLDFHGAGVATGGQISCGEGSLRDRIRRSGSVTRYILFIGSASTASRHKYVEFSCLDSVFQR